LKYKYSIALKTCYVVRYTKEYGRQALTEEEWNNFDKLSVTFHRIDGPALEYANGNKYWYKEDKLDREDGPAVEYANGKYWFKAGIRHREDGPAIEYIDEINNEDLHYWWYIEGEEYTKEDYDKLIQEVKDMPLVLRLVDPRKWVREYK